MEIFICGKGREIELHVSEYLTFREVKEQYYIALEDLAKRENNFSALKDLTHVQFRYNGDVLKDEKRLCDYGIEDGDVIEAASPYSSGGGSHICPYGCGREIPDNYKGCTELLKDHPNYFK
jgi:uncharacterized ubiquitin-like protein YukD